MNWMRLFSTTVLIAILLISAGCSTRKKSATAETDLDAMDQGLSEGADSTEVAGLDALEDEIPSLDSMPKSSSSPAMGSASSSAPIPSRSSAPPLRSGAPKPDPREQLRAASDAIHADLVNEKNAFFFKKVAETEAVYTSPEGTPLLPSSTLSQMNTMMASKGPIDVQIDCKSFDMLVPPGAEEDGSKSATQVDVLGQFVDASVEFTSRTSRPVLNVGLIYTYTVDGGAKAAESKTLQAARMVQYTRSSSGEWRRNRVEERIVPK